MVEAIGLEVEQLTRGSSGGRNPARLVKNAMSTASCLLRHLLFDMMREHVAENAHHLHLDAGVLLNEQLGAVLVCARVRGIEHDSFSALAFS